MKKREMIFFNEFINIYFYEKTGRVFLYKQLREEGWQNDVQEVN